MSLIILRASGAIKWIQPHLPEVQHLRLADEPGAGRKRREVGVDHETHERHNWPVADGWWPVAGGEVGFLDEVALSIANVNKDWLPKV